ncbi:MAG: Maf family protein [Acidobacteriota bacterium]|nr:Maf family protein [Acidobacteriota bacterium]MDH3522568.1 Maf family protein [Acidobacteriota bacterium]
MSRLVLASGSPRRREILAGLGYEFTVRPVDLDESQRPGEGAEDYARRLAREKAAADVRAGEVVLAADTIVVLEGRLLGKPRDAADAAAMLRELAGRSHDVVSGVAVLDAGGEPATAIERTTVRFAPLSRDEIDWYVASGEPMDKAGAYAIQGRGSLFVEAIAGNYSNVVGLPVPAVYRLLSGRGIPRPGGRTGSAGTLSPAPPAAGDGLSRRT